MLHIIAIAAVLAFYLISVGGAYKTGLDHGVKAEAARIDKQTEKLNRGLALVEAVNSRKITRQQAELAGISDDLKTLIAAEPEPKDCPVPVESPKEAVPIVPILPVEAEKPLERKVYIRVCDYSPPLRAKLNEINRRP